MPAPWLIDEVVLLRDSVRVSAPDRMMTLVCVSVGCLPDSQPKKENGRCLLWARSVSGDFEARVIISSSNREATSVPFVAVAVAVAVPIHRRQRKGKTYLPTS